jgi:hypothetical protein
MKKRIWMLALISLTAACSKVSFSPNEVANQKLDGPEVIDPVPVSPPVVVDEPLRKVGECPDQQSVTSCLKCEVPAVPPPPPVVSTKAQKLAKIMTMACQIMNKSYPANYSAPSEAQVQSHLLACSPVLYPETQMSSSQTSTMGRLLDTANPSLRQKMFGGLWYQPPYSDDFELYFGLEASEAASVICQNKGTLSNTLFTSEYAQALSSEGGLDAWSNNPAAQKRWQAAQLQRQQLLSCFNQPGTPWVNPSPVAQEPKKCVYRSFEGNYEQGGREEIQNALAEGYKLAIETSNTCTLVTQTPSADQFHGKLKIAGYRCQ